jgi:hypothetical protein
MPHVRNLPRAAGRSVSPIDWAPGKHLESLANYVKIIGVVRSGAWATVVDVLQVGRSQKSGERQSHAPRSRWGELVEFCCCIRTALNRRLTLLFWGTKLWITTSAAIRIKLTYCSP